MTQTSLPEHILTALNRKLWREVRSMIILLVVWFKAYAAALPKCFWLWEKSNLLLNNALKRLMNSAKTLKFSPQCVNKHSRTHAQRYPDLVQYGWQFHP